MPSRAATAGPLARAPRWVAPALLAALLLGLIALGASIGNPEGPVRGLASVLYVTILGGGPAAAYLAAGVGLGRLLMPLFEGARERFALQAGLGIGLLLTLSHLLGWSGAFGTGAGMIVAAGVVGAGLLLLAHQLAGDREQHAAATARIRLWAAWGLPALALLMVAASNPPGWLWESEGRGYDVLEYHLQLPQEWLALGRVRPLEHNVYSFLPGYVEAAFYHIAVMVGSPGHAPAGSAAYGLLAGEGMPVLSAQFLHAGFAVLGAVLVGRLVIAAARSADPDDERELSAPAALAGALFLSVPWVIVTGSMAYNDLAVAAFLAAALIAALEPRMPPWKRGVAVGLLIGAACGAKPTAIALGAPAAAVALIGVLPARRWVAALGAAAGAGALMLAPWLVRNALACGNPVFPAATELLGSAHWSAEQVARYAAAHKFEGTLLERLALAVLPGPTDPATGTALHRGLLHPQWSVFFPLAVAGAVIGAFSRYRRAVSILGIGMVIQLAAWLAATHIQSRFLIPLAVPGAALIGLAGAAVARRGAWAARGAAGALAAATLLHAGHSLLTFSVQGRGLAEDALPNAPLVPGPPALVANLRLPPGSRLYLLGDARPLYHAAGTVYATTYDRSLLAGAMARSPGEPRAWTGALRAAGVTHILVDYSELDRLARSGFLDPDLSPERLRPWLDAETRLAPGSEPGRIELRELRP
ncbi:MAG: hypothetical protein WD749_05720 [Phycisphaerales bacterium]